MVRLLSIFALLIAAPAVAAEPARDPEPGSAAYYRLLEESPQFRARTVRRECDPIREAELRRLCINSVVAPDADGRQRLQYGAVPPARP